MQTEGREGGELTIIKEKLIRCIILYNGAVDDPDSVMIAPCMYRRSPWVLPAKEVYRENKVKVHTEI